jgi:hypothetical protein
MELYICMPTDITNYKFAFVEIKVKIIMERRGRMVRTSDSKRGSWVRISAKARRGIREQDTLKFTARGSHNKQNCLRHPYNLSKKKIKIIDIRTCQNKSQKVIWTIIINNLQRLTLCQVTFGQSLLNTTFQWTAIPWPPIIAFW